MNKSTTKVVQILLFFLIPVIFLVGSMLTPDREMSEKENRSLAQLPKVTFASLTSGEFMTRFESYMSDQIMGREKIVSTKTFFDRVMGKTEQNGVYIGKKGWLFEKPSVYENEKVEKTTSSISNFCNECGIENQMFVLVPDSTEIVTKRLPSMLSFESQKSQIKRIHSELPECVNCFDAESILSNEENPELLYYKNDHHWTSYAAKSVFDGIAKKWNLNTNSVKYQTVTLSNSFYGTLSSSSGIQKKPDVIETILPENSAGTYIVQNSSEKTRSVSMYDLEKLKSGNQYEVFLGGNFSKLKISTTSTSGNKLLIFKDSFANCMLPMLTPCFSEIVVIDARYFTDDIKTVVADGKFTHLMFLYNVNTFLEDTSLKDVLPLKK